MPGLSAASRRDRSGLLWTCAAVHFVQRKSMQTACGMFEDGLQDRRGRYGGSGPCPHSVRRDLSRPLNCSILNQACLVLRTLPFPPSLVRPSGSSVVACRPHWTLVAQVIRLPSLDRFAGERSFIASMRSVVNVSFDATYRLSVRSHLKRS